MARKNNGSSDRDFSYFVRNIGSKSLFVSLCRKSDIERLARGTKSNIDIYYF